MICHAIASCAHTLGARDLANQQTRADTFASAGAMGLGSDDLLDNIGELVERMSGEVHVLPSTSMPTTTGLAATFRH